MREIQGKFHGNAVHETHDFLYESIAARIKLSTCRGVCLKFHVHQKYLSK
jgi:hypothetical protein